MSDKSSIEVADAPAYVDASLTVVPDHGTYGDTTQAEEAPGTAQHPEPLRERHSRADRAEPSRESAVRSGHQEAASGDVAARPAGKLRLVAVTFDQACAFVAEHHRHHLPPVGHKFSLGAMLGERAVGVAIVGRPVARSLDDGRTLEVTRVATDGTPAAGSFLYAAARRATFALGYDRLFTYTQSTETGASLRGAGWRFIANRPARPGWSCPSRPRRVLGTEYVERMLWEAS